MHPTVRRWLIVAALFTVTCSISTPLAAYGVFLPILAEAFGWSRGAVSSALSISLAVGGVAGLAIGALNDRHGPRALLVLTCALAGGGYALVATVTTLWQLQLLVGLVGGVGMSSFYILGAATVARWFEDRHGLALGLMLVGFNLGYITSGPLAAWLIGQVGWRAAYAVIGGGAGLAGVLAALTVRRPTAAETDALRERARAARPAPAPTGRAAGAGASLGQALVDRRQWYFNLSWLLLGVVLLMTTVHVVPMARDRGLPLAGAALALTAFGLGAVTGRIVSGAVSDVIGARATLQATFVVQAAALAVLPWVPSRAALLGSLAAFGLGAAAADTMFARVVAEVFGVRALGAIMGMLSLGWRFGAAAGPVAAGFLYDATGSYAVPFGVAPLVVGASWALFVLGTRASSTPGTARRAPSR